MSVVTYNGVTLPYAHLIDFREDAVGDEDSDTDWCYVKFTIACQCLLNSKYLNQLAPEYAGVEMNAADVKKIIRPRLLARRKQLSVTFEGHELIPQPPEGNVGKVDARNGPIPRSCEVSQLTNTTMLLTWRCDAHYWENDDMLRENPFVKNKPGNEVLFNRWSESVEIDNCNYSRRTREGKFVIRSDNTEGHIADEVRSQMAVVGVPAGFLRESSKYTVRPDGLAISYSVIDKEVFKKPPDPAFEADGEYYEMTPRGGAVRFGTCRVKLRGSKDTQQDHLLASALSVCSRKLTRRAQQLGISSRRVVLDNADVRVKLYDNEVECSVRWMMAPPQGKRLLGIAGFTGIDTFTPGSDDAADYVPGYQDRGTADLLLQAAAYYDPSLANTILNDNFGNFDPGREVGQVGKMGE